MRRFLIILLLCSSAFGQWQSGVKPMLGRQIDKTHPLGDFVAAWFFNEGSGNIASDLSGNGNDGILSGDLAWVPGDMGSAIDFPGSADFINCGHNLSLDITEELTLIICITPDSIDVTNNTLIGKQGKDAYWLMQNYEDIKFFTGGIANGWFTTSDFLTAGKMTCVGLVYRNSDNTAEVYADGVFQETLATLDMTSQPNADLYFGVDPRDETGLDFNGIMHYGMIYNRALSASEIAELYREPFGMFVKDDIAMLATAAEPPPPPSGQVITIIMTSIPLFLIPFFIIRSKRERN